MSVNAPFTGMWLRKKLKEKFTNKKDFEIAAMLGISPQAFANWGRNDGVLRLPNAETLFLGYKALGLLDEDRANDPSYHVRASGAGIWPVRGLAAADDSEGSRIPVSNENQEVCVDCPPGLTMVPVQGNSMSPVVLPGQYVMIDKAREGFEINGGIVVASIVNLVRDGRDPISGTFVKRCFIGDGFYCFTSINSTYAPFSAWRENCRIWPVVGIWYPDHRTGPHPAAAKAEIPSA